MSLRGEPVEVDVHLPDGRTAHLRIGVPDDGYIAKRDLDTVVVELSANGEHLAGFATALEIDETSEAHEVAREIVKQLEAGTLQPTAGAIERLVDSLL